MRIRIRNFFLEVKLELGIFMRLRSKTELELRMIFRSKIRIRSKIKPAELN